MPDTALLITMAVAVGFVLVFMVGVMALYAKLYVKAEQGTAIIVNKMANVEVFFTGGLVIPTVHRAERIAIHAQTLRIERTGKNGVVCRDSIRADVVATFTLRVNTTKEDILRVASMVGASRASDPATLRELFEARFIEALATVAATKDFEVLHAKRQAFKDRVMELIGEDLSGFVLDDVALEEFRQAPVAALDPENIVDAEGIRKITEITAAKRTEAATLQADARRLLIELETAEGDALAKLRESTGRTRTAEDIERQLDERMKRMLECVVEDPG